MSIPNSATWRVKSAIYGGSPEHQLAGGIAQTTLRSMAELHVREQAIQTDCTTTDTAANRGTFRSVRMVDGRPTVVDVGTWSIIDEKAERAADELAADTELAHTARDMYWRHIGEFERAGTDPSPESLAAWIAVVDLIQTEGTTR